MNPYDLWIPVRDGDPRAVGLYKRHYSANPAKNHHNGISGPGERIVLMTQGSDAIWVWRLYRNAADLGERLNRKGLPIVAANLKYSGLACTVFRNESAILSSTLVREAMAIGRERWPDARQFTFVDPLAVRSRNPGYCFKVCGWKQLPERTTRGLIVLEAEA